MKTINWFLLALVVASTSLFAADWKIDKAHSSANFSVKHMLVSTVHGNFNEFDGTISLDPKDLSTINANMTMQVASINTDNEKRDGHLKSPDFFDAATHPTITFVSKKSVQTAPGMAKLTGDLTMRGVTKEVTFDVEGFNDELNLGEKYVVGGTATTTVNRQDYGVNWSKTLDNGGAVAGDNVKITVELELNRPAS